MENRTLIKYVVVSPRGDWLSMHDSFMAAKIVADSCESMTVHVERWTYHVAPDGTHSGPCPKLLCDSDGSLSPKPRPGAIERLARQARGQSCSHSWHHQGTINGLPFWICQTCGAERSA